jgi:hypothetical protein
VEQWVVLHAAPALAAPLEVSLGLGVALPVHWVIHADLAQSQLDHVHNSLLR